MAELYAQSFLEMSYTDVARRENVGESSIRCSVCEARGHLKKILKVFDTGSQVSLAFVTAIERVK